MGANAQTTVPTFTVGQILTSAEQNTGARTGVPVFATTVTRDAAFGGANKDLAEGQLCYLESTDVVQYYTGAAWATVGPTSAVGLTFISSTTIPTANTTSLPASSFTSTYQNYLLVVTTSAASTSGNLSFRYRAAGTDDSGSTYNTGGFNVTTGGTIGSDSISGGSQSSHRIGYYGSADYPMMQITLFNPQGASNSRFNSVLSGVNSTAAAVAVNYSGGIMYTNTQYDSLTLIASGATTITGTARLYGYLNS